MGTRSDVIYIADLRRTVFHGLPGVHPDSLLKVNTGDYGLREAPRLWYLKASRVLKQCGWEELKTARSCYVLRDKKDDNKLVGM